MSEWLTLVTAMLTLATAGVAWCVRGDVHRVHLSVNSRLDELLDETRRVAHGLGVAEGLAQARDRAEAERELRLEQLSTARLGAMERQRQR